MFALSVPLSSFEQAETDILIFYFKKAGQKAGFN
jgi:hypothetical protein